MDVLAALAGCVTTADHYRVQLDAENLLAPPEVDALQAAPLPDPARAWVDRLAVMCNRIRAPRQPFRRRDLAANVSLYEGSAPPGTPRSLVVGFTGVGLRMMMPTAPFLQALPAERCDVVVLRDSSRNAFLGGVPGYAPDLPALVERLAADLPAGRHADISCIGCSSGGTAALAFGALAGARMAISLGGGHPLSRARRPNPLGLDLMSFGRWIAAAGPRTARLVCAHGDGSVRDSIRNRLLWMALPGTEMLVVRGVGDHAVLSGLLPHKALGRFLEEVLLDGALPADGVWQP